YAITPARPLELIVQGPTLLHLWSKAMRQDEDAVAQLRVIEGGRERALSGATIPHVQRSTSTDPAIPGALAPVSATPRAEEPPEQVSLRRAVVHVPPGKHRYKVEITGGEAWVFGLSAREITHLEDAAKGTKSEVVQLARARGACPSAPTICILAL